MRSAPHDRLAAGASWGSAGVYRARAGDGRNVHAHAHWFDKPGGMSYAALDALLAPLLSAERTLWQRHMVLGAAPEFCLASDDALALPAALTSRSVPRPKRSARAEGQQRGEQESDGAGGERGRIAAAIDDDAGQDRARGRSERDR